MAGRQESLLHFAGYLDIQACPAKRQLTTAKEATLHEDLKQIVIGSDLYAYLHCILFLWQ
ncbi:hypothetical protein B7P43_G05999 [Cryptotermes secundus]|uniref:Uncharacterized protein n=1 Tax=Cryptotermes secundus TaxID=105785 RepID=A0A2J7QA59_9NEOP|nr:hypothetical protein B7P43_G05999 [Cryptotermes secundus]